MSVVTHECLSDALSAAQKDFGHIVKNKTANVGKYTYDYADIADVIAAVTPALSANGLCQMQRLAIRDGHQILVSELMHKQESKTSEMILPVAGLDPQGVGRVLTFYRRYALQALLGVAAERDDDAADTHEVRQPEAARRAPEPDTHDLLVHAGRLLEAVEAAEGRDELADIARQAKGTFEERPFWPRLVQADRSLAGELQQAIRAKALGFSLDLSTV